MDSTTSKVEELKTPYGIVKPGAVITIGEGDQALTFRIEANAGFSVHGWDAKLVDDHYQIPREFYLSFRIDVTDSKNVRGVMGVYSNSRYYVTESDVLYHAGKNEWFIDGNDVKAGKVVKWRFTSSKPRDSQRQKLYDAECAFNHATHRLETLEEVQEYVDSITRTRWWKSRYFGSFENSGWRFRGNGKYQVRIKDGRGSATSYRLRGEVKMPHWSRYKGIVLHELAHQLVPPQYAGHGPEFAKMYLLMVKRYMGRDAWRFLKWQFDRYGIKYRTSYYPKISKENGNANR